MVAVVSAQTRPDDTESKSVGSFNNDFDADLIFQLVKIK